MKRLAVASLAALVVTACGGGESKPDCRGASVVCGDLCVDLAADGLNCGACGNDCPAGHVCSGGACALSCQAGLVDCGGTCVDPMTDRAHCGATGACEGPGAGAACADGEVCSDGACALSCQAGLVACDGRCVDPMTDRGFCGASGDCEGTASGAACRAGELCSAGTCALSCQAGLVACDGKCVDPRSDPAWCGADAACGGGQACAAGFACSAGACALSCQAGLVDCDGRCVDPRTDRAFCGASGACEGPEGGTVCAAGEVCSGGTCALSCQAGLVDCGGICVDPRSDRAHCGASGTCTGAEAGLACDAGASCYQGACVALCEPGQVHCDGSCVDPLSDPAHCGASGYCTGATAGTACAAGTFCHLGACVACATAAQCDDGNACTEDVCIAGACGHTFAAGAACDDGDACTFADACTAGVCSGTPLSCTNDPGPCGAQRSCNGTAACAVAYPGPEVACSDGHSCTWTDRCDGAGSCGGVALMPDQAPVAPGGNLTALEGGALVLDASGAYEPDAWCGDAVALYEWDLDDDGVFDVSSTTPTTPLAWVQLSPYGPFAVADPAAGFAPSYPVRLRVTDRMGAATQATFALRVCQPGAIAVPAVSPSTAGCGVDVVFDGTASSSRDFRNRIIAYRWDLDTAVDSSGNGNPADDVDAVGSRVTYRHTRPGAHTARLTVQDDAGATASADVTATLAVSNRPPVADPGGPYSAGTTAGGAWKVNLDGRASWDPDAPCDRIVSWQWDTDNDDLFGAADTNGSALCGATDCVGQTLLGVGDPGWLLGRTYRVALRVVDESGAVSPVAETTIATADPAAPGVVLVSPMGGEALRGQADLRLKVSQVRGQAVTLEAAVNGVPVPLTGGSTVSPPADGSPLDVVRAWNTAAFASGASAYSLTVTARLTAQPTVLAQDVSRPFTIDNGAPTITLPAGETAPVLELTSLAGTPFTFHPTATDSLDPAPRLVSTAPAAYALGTTNVTFTAVDWAGNVAARTVPVVVRDTTAPQVSLPAPGRETVVATGPRGARGGEFPLPTPWASDAGTTTAQLLSSVRVSMTLRDGAGAPVAPPAGGWPLGDAGYAGLWFPPGETVVTYRATDASGNAAQAALAVEVVP